MPGRAGTIQLSCCHQTSSDFWLASRESRLRRCVVACVHGLWRAVSLIEFDIRQFVGARMMIICPICSSRSDAAELITMPRHKLPAPRWSMGPMFPIANGVPLRYSPVATWALISANSVIFLFQLSLSPFVARDADN